MIMMLMAIASSEACFEWARTYVKERNAFGKPLLSNQTVQHKLAEMKTEVCINRAFADQCLVMHQNGVLDTAQASMAKYALTDLQVSIADRALQLHGGAGYMLEYPVAKAFVDARVQPIYGG